MIGIRFFYTASHYTDLSFRTKGQLKQFLTRLGDYDSRWYEVIIYPIALADGVVTKRGKLPLNDSESQKEALK